MENTEINISADYDEQNAEFHGREPINDVAAPNLFEVAFNKGSLQYVELKGLSAVIEHQLANGMQFDSLTGIRQTVFQNSADEDYTAVTWSPGINPFADTQSAIGEDSEQFSQEFRLLSPANDQFDYVVGLYYFEQTNDATTSAGVGNNIATVRVPASVDTTSYAAYIHGNYQLTDQLQFTGGLRYTNEKKSIDFAIIDTTGTFTNGTFVDDRKVSDLSPKVGLNYSVNDDLMIYANYARGFKSGGWNADFVESLQGLGFDDEQVDSVEMGLKSTLLQERIRLNAALYRSDYSDFQVQQFVELPDGTTDIILTNAGEVTAQGLELDINFAISDSLTLFSTYGYTDATFDSFKNGGGDGIDFDGNELPDAPNHSFNIGLQGVFPIFETASLVAQVDYSSRSDFFTNPNNADNTKVDAYNLLNARIGVESDDGVWSVFLWSRNLTDNDDPTYKSRSFLGIPRAVYMEPRMVGLTVNYRFGEF
jgi:iron complex outermembrane receptor protein